MGQVLLGLVLSQSAFGAEAFKNVDDLKDVTGFDAEILLPAATQVLADLEAKRKSAPAATPTTPAT